MKKWKDIDAALDDYFDHSMPAAERRAFERSAKRDAGLGNELAFRKRVQATLRHKGEFALAGELARITAGIPVTADPEALRRLEKQAGVARPFFLNGKWLWGGLFAAALVAVATFVSPPFSSSLEAERALFNEYSAYHQPGFNLPGNAPEALRLGLQAYQAREYPLAAGHLRAYGDIGMDTDAALLLGISLSETGDYTQAALYLRQVVDAGDQPNIPAARKYLALCLLMQGEHAAAIGELREIGDDAQFGREARALIQRIGLLQ